MPKSNAVLLFCFFQSSPLAQQECSHAYTGGRAEPFLLNTRWYKVQSVTVAFWVGETAMLARLRLASLPIQDSITQMVNVCRSQPQ